MNYLKFLCIGVNSDVLCCVFFLCFQAEDGIRDLVRSRGLGDVYKRQDRLGAAPRLCQCGALALAGVADPAADFADTGFLPCLLYTSDAADERSSVDLGGRRIIQKKNKAHVSQSRAYTHSHNQA